jgi:ubiquinone biosynthesis protein UbiJ
MLERSALFAVNHLLSHNPEAAALLGAHAGQCLRFRAPPLPDLLARIGEDGRLRAIDDVHAAADAPAGAPTKPPDDSPNEPDLQIEFNPLSLPWLAATDPALRARALRDMRIAGNVELAALIQQLASSLRWDAEEDLSRVVGDVLAHRIAGAGRTLLASSQDNALRAALSLSEYWLYEQPLLSSRAALQAFTQSLQQVQTRTSLLEQRLRSLEERRPQSTKS